MTGTGSGKTESFLLPILGKFAREAEANPGGFGGQPAMRALILYPMNALVNDQLGRLRSLFGDPRLVEAIQAMVRAAAPVCALHKPDALCRRPHDRKGLGKAQVFRRVLCGYRALRQER